MLGVVQGVLLLLFITILLDQYFLHTGIPTADDELAFLRDILERDQRRPSTGRILHESVIPAFMGIVRLPPPGVRSSSSTACDRAG